MTVPMAVSATVAASVGQAAATAGLSPYELGILVRGAVLNCDAHWKAALASGGDATGGSADSDKDVPDDDQRYSLSECPSDKPGHFIPWKWWHGVRPVDVQSGNDGADTGGRDNNDAANARVHRDGGADVQTTIEDEGGDGNGEALFVSSGGDEADSSERVADCLLRDADAGDQTTIGDEDSVGFGAALADISGSEDHFSGYRDGSGDGGSVMGACVVTELVSAGCDDGLSSQADGTAEYDGDDVSIVNSCTASGVDSIADTFIGHFTARVIQVGDVGKKEDLFAGHARPADTPIGDESPIGAEVDEATHGDAITKWSVQHGRADSDFDSDSFSSSSGDASEVSEASDNPPPPPMPSMEEFAAIQKANAKIIASQAEASAHTTPSRSARGETELDSDNWSSSSGDTSGGSEASDNSAANWSSLEKVMDILKDLIRTGKNVKAVRLIQRIRKSDVATPEMCAKLEKDEETLK